MEVKKQTGSWQKQWALNWALCTHKGISSGKKEIVRERRRSSSFSSFIVFIAGKAIPAFLYCSLWSQPLLFFAAPSYFCSCWIEVWSFNFWGGWVSRLFLGRVVCSVPVPEEENILQDQSMFPVMLLVQAVVLPSCNNLLFLSPGERWVIFIIPVVPLLQNKPEVCFPGTCIGNTDSRHFTNITKAIYRFSPLLLRQDDLPRYRALHLGSSWGGPRKEEIHEQQAEGNPALCTLASHCQADCLQIWVLGMEITLGQCQPCLFVPKNAGRTHSGVGFSLILFDSGVWFSGAEWILCVLQQCERCSAVV